MLVLGTGQLFFQVAYRAWLPEVSDETRLSQATAALEASDAASVLVGYPLAGSLIAWVGPTIALGADALSYAISALTLFRLRSRPMSLHAPTSTGASGEAAPVPPAPSPVREPLRPRVAHAWADAFAGVRFVLSTRAQYVLKSAGLATYLVAGSIEVLLATLTQERLHLPAWQAGLIFGASGIGGLLASALAPRIYAHGWERGLRVALGIAAVGCLGLAGACPLDQLRGFLVAFCSELVLDGGVALCFVLMGTANTLTTPAEVRGRVNAATTLYSAAVRAVAVIGGGALAAAGDPRSAFLGLAACCVSAALLVRRLSR